LPAAPVRGGCFVYPYRYARRAANRTRWKGMTAADWIFLSVCAILVRGFSSIGGAAMKLPKTFFKKMILGVVLIAAAALTAYILKEMLDTKNPESALPVISVRYEYGENALSNEREVRRAGWEWEFFLTNEKTPMISLDDVPITPVDVLPGARMTISFSKEPTDLRIFERAYAETPSEFREMAFSSGNAFYTPTQPGRYYYKIYAEWPRGMIQYYFALQVKELAR